MNREYLQKSKGITLIALVITIIVLLILAGVTISFVVGDSGIVNKAKEAKQNMTNATEEENTELQDIDQQMNTMLNNNDIPTKPEEPFMQINELQEGDYVAYKDGAGNVKKAILLYGAENSNYGNYGIQIIIADNVKELSYGNRLGTTSSDRSAFDTSRESYNSLITNLNQEAENYRIAQNNSILKSARSVGSVPDNPNSEGGIIPDTYGYLSQFGEFRNTDENYSIDVGQLEKLVSDGKIESIGDNYWLASRYAIPVDGTTTVRGRCVVNGYDDDTNFCFVYNTGGITSYDSKYYLRVVFTLNEELNVKITGGEGTEAEPYMLEL